jgi:uncharacterized protein (DUF433 family)
MAYVEERDGGLYLAGTRVSLDSIIHCFNEGMTPESILDQFDTLSLRQIYGAITYYLENQIECDAYLVRRQRRFQETRRTAARLPERLQTRLHNARQSTPSE